MAGGQSMTVWALVVFDLAGTTIEDDGRVADVFRDVLTGHGLADAAGRIGAVRGRSKREAIRALVGGAPDGAARAARIYDDFACRLSETFEERPPRPIAGAHALFVRLQAAGVRVALTTGFEWAIAAPMLERLGWLEETVDAIVCADDVERGRPAPDLIVRAMALTGVSGARMVAAVGDTTADVMAGAAAGVGWNVAVLSGAHGRDALERAGATAIIPSVADLGSVLPVI
jgi:phosphonatase-like hydrolase